MCVGNLDFCKHLQEEIAMKLLNHMELCVVLLFINVF